MGGGLMQLVAYGAQDVYLTGQPQITFFKVVYRRHTNFSVEPIQQTFQGAAEFGRTITCNVNRNGDLISHMYLVAIIGKGTRTDTNNNPYGWVSKLGYAMIENVKVEVGGSKIDEQYGDWLNVWAELTRNCCHDVAHNKMIGNVSELTKIGGGDANKDYTMYVPLKFWFNRNNGLALPLIALQYHDVRVTFKLREACHLINYTGATEPTVTNDKMKDAYLLIDYIYLDSEERKRFAQAAHEYLIEQVQFTGDETYNSENQKYRLNFNHPSKFIVWNHGLSRYTDKQQWVSWAVDGDWEKARELFAKRIWIATRKDLGKNGTTYSVTFDDSTMELGDVSPVAGTTVLATTSTAYILQDKVDAQFLFDGTNAAGGVNATENNVVILRNDLTWEDMNFVIGELGFETAATNNTDYLKSVGPQIRDYFNYSNNPNCDGNPTKTAKLQLNGHDRFAKRDGNYFNYVQPYQHFSVTPCDGINVYSFALKPEDHQPSGTCNFSRIDNTTLNLETTHADAPMKDKTVGKDGVTRIYCVNYNVFRVMSGMGGLAYSN
jgi:hypothetical protein